MERKKCPYCGEEIAATAKKCRFCGEWLSDVPSAAFPATPPSSAPATSRSSATVNSQPSAPVNPQPAQAPIQQSQAQAEAVRPVEAIPEQQPVYASAVPESPWEAQAEEETTDAPSFFQAYFVNPYIRRYADFSGYTSRKSFWLTYVATAILSIGLTGLVLLLASFGTGGMICGSILSGIIGLGLAVPCLALSVRRLRDAGKNPWMILLALIPVIGSIIVLVFFCLPSQYEDTEEEGRWQMPDWIVSGACVVLLILGVVLGLKSLGGMTSGSGYDLGSYGDDSWETDEEVYAIDEDYTDPDTYSIERNSNYASRTYTLADLADNLDPDYFTYQLKTYRMGSDDKMNQMSISTGSTNVDITAQGRISDHDLSMEGWITEDGTIHGRYHNTNGIDLDFNGYVRQDNSLYIQLGHGSEKSEWILHPVSSELGSGYARYEGYWGKNKKDSYLVFTAD